MGITAGSVYLDVVPRISKGFGSDLSKSLKDPLDDAEKTAGKKGAGIGAALASPIGKAAGALGLAFGAYEGVNFFKSAIKGASDLSETTNKATVVFGDAFGGVQKWAQTANSALGLTKNQALATAASFGDFFSQMGFGQGQAATMSQDLIKLAADIGSFSNLESADVLDRISASLRGEYDSLQAIVPTINAAAVEQRALAMSGKTVAGELTAQEKATATLALVQEGAKNSANDMAETQGGLANTMKRGSARFDEMKASIGTALLPVMTELGHFVVDTLLPGLMTLADDIPKVIDKFKEWIDNTKELIKWATEHKTQIEIIAGVITAVLLPALIRLGIEALISGTKQAAAWTMAQVGAVKTAAVYVTTSLGMVASWVLLGTQSLLNAAKVVAGWVMTGVGAIAAAGIMAIQVGIMVAGWVLLGLQSLLNAAKVAAAWLIAMGPIGLVIAAVIGLVAIIIANWDTIKEVIGAGWEWIKTATAAAWQWMKDAVSKAIDAIVFIFLNFTGPGLIIHHWETIKAATAAAFRWMRDRVEDFVNFFLELPGKMSRATSGLFDGIKEAFRSALNWIISKWNDLRLTIPEIDTHIPGVGKVGGFSVDTPNVPLFAAGGVARGTFIAGESGAELVTVGQASRVYSADDTLGIVGSGNVIAKHYHYHNEAKLMDPLEAQFREMERLELPI